METSATNVEYASMIEKSFVKFLMNAGFPNEAIVYQPSMSNQAMNYKPDFGIISLKTKELIAVVEVKGRLTGDHADRAIAQVLKLLTGLKNSTIKSFIASPSDEAGDYSIFHASIDEDGKTKLSSVPIFNYSSLVSEFTSEKNEKIKQDKANTTDKFKISCWIISFVLLVLFLRVLTFE